VAHLIWYWHRSGDKFQSPGKWPAFAKAATEESVLLEEDFSVGILRTVIVCKQCSKEIGHVYNDAQQLGTTTFSRSSGLTLHLIARAL
jgi:peptide methionine sulfoxide reductase MsrB